ncbi:family 43 glycosylhydrolase [Sphingobacterium sp. SG20118]|uniref:family 43 glycosylhydrolase n=1 Tax=Sphingobacterium sp. SG20118 TaxID=3367156 RepID=UPI0037DFC24C
MRKQILSITFLLCYLCATAQDNTPAEKDHVAYIFAYFLANDIKEEQPFNITHGQEIDSDVFRDPKTGKHYLYWGNGYTAVEELNDDMLGINKESIKVITPDSAFREGFYVFYRKDIYYFLWSEDDTRSEDYRVRYGTSTSPTGSIQIPDNNLILTKNPELGIYGTGHNAVLQTPGEDKCFIVYHRIKPVIPTL